MGYLSITILFCACLALQVNCGHWRRLNSAPVCYFSYDDQFGEFNATFDLDVEVIRLVHRSGSHECDFDAGGYFGCELFAWTLMAINNDEPMQQEVSHASPQKRERRATRGAVSNFMKEAQSYYRRNDDSYKTSLSSKQAHPIDPNDAFDGPGPELFMFVYAFFTDDNNTIIAPGAPFTVPRYILPGLLRPAWDSFVDLPLDAVPYSIRQGETYRVWHGDDLLGESEDDNDGEMCVDIMGWSKC